MYIPECLSFHSSGEEHTVARSDSYQRDSVCCSGGGVRGGEGEGKLTPFTH